MHPVRTITLGLAEPHPIATSAIRRAAAFLRQTRTRFTEAGHEVQTVRLSTRPLFDDMADQSNTTIARYVSELQRALNDLGLEYCSIGPAPAARVHFPLDRLDLVADLLIANPAINATVQLAESINTQPAWRPEAAVPTARIIKRLAAETAEGFGNFRFAALACMPPGTPFFPAAYHDPATFTGFSLGLQGASIIAEAISTLRKETPLPLPLERITEHVGQALISQQWTYRKLTYPIEQEYNIRYAGIDHSPAPLADDSIAAAIELCGYGPFGSPGTLSVVAALTKAIKGVSSPFSVGYNGLMLPVLEDALLGQRWAERLVNLQQLLLYSSVCGTGLDTIPLPGDIAEEELARILLDVATLAMRAGKPLSARLFPVPGKRTGERTAFSSPYLVNTLI